MSRSVSFFLTVILSLLILPSSFGQNGKLVGRVTDSANGEGLMMAIIRIDSTTLKCTADEKGNFVINDIPPGMYTVRVNFDGYKPKEIHGVQVAPGETKVLNFILGDMSVNMLGDFEVWAVEQTNNDNHLTKEMKQSDGVVVGYTGVTSTKNGDPSVADGLKRMPGVTVIENRFIMVRGLNDRYNSVWLNDGGAPSSETDKRSFSFDIIPSGAVDRVLIFKTPSPDLPSDFAGGMVKVYTRSIPEDKKLTINFQDFYRDGTSLKPFYSTTSAPTQWMGYSNGFYSIPYGTPEYIGKNDPGNDVVSRSFANTWGIHSYNALPDQRFSATWELPVKCERVMLGNTLGLNYSNTNATFTIHRQDWDSLAQTSDYTDIQSTNTVRGSLLENFSILSRHHQVDFKNIFNQNASSYVTMRESNYENGPNERLYVEGYEEKTTYSGQLSGKHTFFDERTEYKWTAGYAHTSKDVPDLKRIKYTKLRTAPDSMYSAAIANTVDPVNGGGRFFSSLDEKVYSFSHGIKQKIKVRNYEFEVLAGNYFEYKSRMFAARVLGYTIAPSFQAFNLKRLPLDQIFDPANVGIPGGFRIDEITSSSDKYNAQNKLLASYIMFKLPLGKKIKVSGGVRYESNVQSLQSYLNQDSIHPQVTTRFLLPSVNVVYSFKKDTSFLHLSYGKTLNRPEFREWSPFYFYDFNFSSGTYGSLFPTVLAPQGETLKVAEIYNYDLRYEWYPSRGNFIQAGVFYKQFIHPIQQVILNSGGSDSRAFTFTNAESAYSRGVEVDLRKNFACLDGASIRPFFADLNFVANVAIIQSQQKITKVINQTTNNPLQGQSPYIVNAGLYYQNDSIGTQVTILYNVFGPRVYLIGTLDYANIGELSRHTLDVLVTQKISEYFALTFGVQDILNQPVRLVQDTNRNNKFEKSGDDMEIMSYKRGRYYSFGIRFKF